MGPATSIAAAEKQGFVKREKTTTTTSHAQTVRRLTTRPTSSDFKELLLDARQLLDERLRVVALKLGEIEQAKLRRRHKARFISDPRNMHASHITHRIRYN